METTDKDRVIYERTAADLIYLVSCAVNKLIPDSDIVEKIDLDILYELAYKQSLLSAAAYALESAGKAAERFSTAKAASMRREILYDAERRKIFSRFDEIGLWYMPLKGAVLKNDYPSLGMREMGDNDVLCDPDRMREVREVMESLGFECKKFEDEFHDIYVKKPSLMFEMHSSLVQEEIIPELVEYYSDVKSRLIPDGNGTCGYHFSSEDFYIYMTVHEYKHIKAAGTGVRSLLDTYVYLTKHKGTLDMVYIDATLKALDIDGFEKENRELAFAVFSPENLGAELPAELDYYFWSSTYGNSQQANYKKLYRGMHGSDSRFSKLGYIIRIVFPTGKALKKRFPFFYKHKILLPFLYVFRPFQVLFHIRLNKDELGRIRDFRLEE